MLTMDGGEMVLLANYTNLEHKMWDAGPRLRITPQKTKIGAGNNYACAPDVILNSGSTTKDIIALDIPERMNVLSIETNNWNFAFPYLETLVALLGKKQRIKTIRIHGMSRSYDPLSIKMIHLLVQLLQKNIIRKFSFNDTSFDFHGFALFLELAVANDYACSEPSILKTFEYRGPIIIKPSEDVSVDALKFVEVYGVQQLICTRIGNFEYRKKILLKCMENQLERSPTFNLPYYSRCPYQSDNVANEEITGWFESNPHVLPELFLKYASTSPVTSVALCWWRLTSPYRTYKLSWDSIVGILDVLPSYKKLNCIKLQVDLVADNVKAWADIGSFIFSVPNVSKVTIEGTHINYGSCWYATKEELEGLASTIVGAVGIKTLAFGDIIHSEIAADGLPVLEDIIKQTSITNIGNPYVTRQYQTEVCGRVIDAPNIAKALEQPVSEREIPIFSKTKSAMKR